jgi:hypothetical protein
MIFTSNNASIEALDKSVGSRLASRIWNTSTVVEIKGGDWRG